MRDEWLSIEEILHARSQRPKFTSRNRGLDGVTIDVHQPVVACAESFPGLDHHLINVWTSGRARLIQRRAGVVHDSFVSGGTLFIMPAGYESVWEGDAGGSARLRVPTSLVCMGAEQLGRQSALNAEILNNFGIRDSMIERLSQILVAELDKKPHPAQLLIWDSVSTALVAHLVEHHNGLAAIKAYDAPIFGSVELARLRAYVEDNLDRSIGLAEMAGVVNVSRFHFARLFKRSTGTSAISFVERCRIRRAEALIKETDIPLAEVALATGFYDQSHFTRRFQVHVGCTPATYARERGRRRSGRR